MTLNTKDDNAALVEAILSKNWEELQTMEFAGYLLFPEELQRRRKDGTFESIPVMLRVPREHEMRKARVQARQWAKDEGLVPELDPDLFDNMDTMCTLALAIRNITEPHEPFEPDPKRLEQVYDRVCLDALWGKLEAYRTVLDPRPDTLSETETMAVIAAVAKVGNLVPLAAFGGRSQNSLVVSMARQLVSSPTFKS